MAGTVNDEEIRAFLGALYPDDVPTGTILLIWTLPGKFSYWSDTLDGAAKIIFREAENENDVYLGAGLSWKKYGKKGRVPKTEIAGIPGLWADIDYADSVHSKKDKLPTQDEALEFIELLPIPPTITVHSGHGYQCWWALDIPWVFQSNIDRERGAGIARRWHHQIKSASNAKGWTVDSTLDLARVMRVPGTANYKNPQAVVPTSLVEINRTRRYSIEQFGEPMQAEFTASNERSNGSQQPAGSLVLDPSVEPPSTKMLALVMNNPDFQKSLQRQRPDFDDQSASSYDMSLASFAVNAGWNDQEVVNLLIASRREHGDDLKLREDYYQRTIARARKGIVTVDDADVTAEDKLATLSRKLGMEVISVTKYISEPPKYVMRVDYLGEVRAITFDSAGAITSQRTFSNKIVEVTNRLIPKVPEKQWPKMAQLFFDCLVEEEIGPDSYPVATMNEWTRAYLDSHIPTDEWEEAGLVNRPYLKDGMVHISSRSLASWLRNVEGERMSSRNISQLLKQSGWENDVHYFRPKGAEKPTTRGVWRRPWQ